MKVVAPHRKEIQALVAFYKFAHCELNLRERTLYCGGTPVDLSPKEMQTLILLVQNAGEALSREWLVQRIWPDTVVGDTSLARNVSALRKHLGAESIRSLPKFGYRFTLPVEAVDFAEPATLAAAPETDPIRAFNLPHSQVAGQGLAAGAIAGESRKSAWWKRGSAIAWAAFMAVCVCCVVVAVSLHWYRKEHAASQRHAAASRWDEAGMFSLTNGTPYRATGDFSKALELEPESALLHAHAADAFFQLERVGDAQDQSLLATDLIRTSALSSGEVHYIHAVNAMVARDFAAAITEYKAWGEELPTHEKWQADEDLGRAYSAAGKTADAMQYFVLATQLDPYNGGVHLRLARLKALQRQWDEAAALLQRATGLYEHDSNLEGQAEVAYQSGTIESARTQYKLAEDFYSRSLALSRQLGDLQLAGRAVGALSNVERWEGRLDDSLRDAKEALLMGRESGSEYSIAGSLTLLANVALARRDAATARPLLQEALELETRVRNMRQTANAEFSLATLLQGVGEYDQAAHMAEQARDHYRANHSIDGMAEATVLLIHASASTGSFTRALTESQTLLKSSTETHNKRFEGEAEAAMGETLLLLERDNDALTHLRRAVALSRETDNGVWIKSLHLADALAKLGRVAEARAALTAVELPKRQVPDTEQWEHLTEADLAMATGRFAKAISDAREAQTYALDPAHADREIEIEVLALSAMNRATEAAAMAGQFASLPAITGSAYGRARADLLKACAGVSHDGGATRDNAHAAADYFKLQGMFHSARLAQSLLMVGSVGEENGSASRRSANLATARLLILRRTATTRGQMDYVQRPLVATNLNR